MAGICGYAGEPGESVDFGIDLTWTGQEFEGTFEDEWLQVSQVGHSDNVGDQPLELQSGEKLWIWGDVYGRRNDDRYTSRRSTGLSTLEFLERTLGRDWRRGVSGLNGSFLIAVYDPNDREVHLVTDKLLSRSLYYTSTEKGLVFSPRLQSIYLETDLSPALDHKHLQAYFADRLSGIYTPIQDTYLCQPGSILTYDIRSGDLSVETYWRPEHEPTEKSLEWFTDEFVRRLKAAIEDRMLEERDVSLLLSGGGDSRLLAAVLDSLDIEYSAYHATSWESGYETTIARTVADQLGIDLTVLRRDSDHFEELLGEALQMYSFHGRYEQAHLEPLMDEVNQGTELLLTGGFSDPTFKGWHLPKRSIPTGIDNIYDVELGGFRLNNFTNFWLRRADPPYYYTSECQPLSTTIHQNIHCDGDEVVHHGISFRSAKDLFMSWGFYPSAVHTSPYFRHSLLENSMLRTPFMDDRLIDLYLEMPAELVFESNLMNMALSKINPQLSVIANASTAFPPAITHDYHENTNFNFPEMNRHLTLPEPPEDWQGHDAWGYAMHNDDLIQRAILDNQETIESASFLDDELLLEQANGGDPWEDHDRFHGYAYRGLLSFICSPIADQLV